VLGDDDNDDDDDDDDEDSLNTAIIESLWEAEKRRFIRGS